MITMECYSPCIPTGFLEVTSELKRWFATSPAFDHILFSFWEAWDVRLIRSGPYCVRSVATPPTCMTEVNLYLPLTGLGPTIQSISSPFTLANILICLHQCYVGSEKTRMTHQLATDESGYQLSIPTDIGIYLPKQMLFRW